jgi:serine/threonine protein kinase
MTRAFGRYELLRPIARGGMAEVYLARRRGAAGVEKRLVIKRIRPERSASPRLLELFVREARLSMALTHQNIVPVFDFGRAGDELFLAMEHVEGHDLGAALARAARRAQAIDPVLAAFVAAECCQALDYAHTRTDAEGVPLGVVHRDVTPRNVLLSTAGEVKLVDFGVASLSGETGGGTGGRVRGTPAYMAPEQARAEAVDGRADLFALGVILWEALSNRRARGGEPPQVLEQARRGELPPLPADVPEALVRVVVRATAVAPADRFADARAMAEALDAFIVGARAARPDLPAPARRLAAWLRDLWPEGDDPPPLTPSDLPEGPAATFVDDGEAAVLGATQRSIAATMAEGDEAPAPAAPGPAPGVISAPPGPPAGRRRWPFVVFPLLAGAIALFAAYPRASAPVRAPVVASAPPLPDAAPAPPPPPPDAAPVPPPPPDAAPAPPPPPVHRRVPPSAPPSPPAAALPPRRVTLGARPWARFTIDSDPAPHETPETVVLAPGKHIIHFENPEMAIRRDVPIVVPADRDLAYVENLLER